MTCAKTADYKNEDEWRQMLEGFTRTWNPERIVEEFIARIRVNAEMRLGL